MTSRTTARVRVKLPVWLAKREGLPRIVDVEAVSGAGDGRICITGSGAVESPVACCICGRDLTHPVSQRLGIGPVCAPKVGVPWTADTSPEAVDAFRVSISRATRFEERWLPTSKLRVIEGDLATMIPEGSKPLRRICANGDGFFTVAFAYDPELVAAVKRINGRRYDPKRKLWSVPRQPAELLHLGRAHGFAFLPEGLEAELETEAVDAPPATRAEIEPDGKHVALTMPYDIETLAAVRRITGARFRREDSSWIVPVTSASDVRDFFADGAPSGIHVSDEVGRALDREVERAAELTALSDAWDVTDFEPPATLGGELYPFQRSGIAYVLNTRRTFIADEMGLGKTITALATVEAAGAYPCVVVCPATLKPNWRRETEKWLPNRSVAVVSGRSGPIAASAEVLIVNYDVLAARLDELRGIGLRAVVLDESHYVKSPKAARSKAAAKLAKGVDIRLCLTGTPILNRPVELIQQLRVLGRLEEVGGNWHNFVTRYCGAYRDRFGWRTDGATNLDELNLKLRSTCYVRRLKADVLSELPAKRRATVPMEIDNQREYDRAMEDLVAWVRDEAMRTADTAEEGDREARRRAAAAHRAEQLVRIAALRLVAVRGKMEMARRWIADFLESGEKLVVFAHHREIQAALVVAFPGCARLVADDGPEERQRQVDAFQDDPDVRLIVCSLKAGGIGVTLTAASNVAFLETGWTPADMDQAEDRLHRIGQAESVTAWYLVAEGTIDEWMAELIDEKRKVVAAATDGREVEPTEMLVSLLARLSS